jgi:3-deoxy-7-phosphoheptulonate synthase
MNRALTPDSVVEVAGTLFGGDKIVVIAGPCAVESYGQTLETARAVKASGAALLRGGAFKPRTSPHDFQGLEYDGLKILADIGDRMGLGIVSEMTAPDQAFLFEELVDMIQIGTRNMANYELLKAAARTGKPILLKRGFAATLKEWIGAAEYIMGEGNTRIVMCERGIRTFCDHSRYTLDLSAMLALKATHDMPVIIDPSHAAGALFQVEGLGLAAIAAGADGLLVEAHVDPGIALCDGKQSLDPNEFESMMCKADFVARAVGRNVR